jgi:DNA-nicking Smr family endonuclease
MKSRKPSLTYNPFEEIKDLLETKSISLPEHSPVNDEIEECPEEPSPELEEKLFVEAMEGVRPISRDNCVERVFQIDLPEGSKEKEDAETLAKLTDLVRSGIGFNIFDTPEYIEGTGYNIHPEIARRLHRGDFSIQAHIDLHGLVADDAKEAFERFLKCSVITGKRGVLIIHGRGLSSPAEPVLKRKVVEWLTRGLWRKWVIAYASARSCDGGAGATYVLLRQRPVSKRLKTRSKRRFSTFFG